MSKVSKIIPIVTIIGGFTIAILDAYTEAEFNPNFITALIYAGLGSSAAVGFSKYWRK